MDKKYISLEEVRRPAHRWIIDRFEESWAVLENPDTREVISIPVNQLPQDARPGTTLIRTEMKWYVNEADTAERAARIKEKFAQIKSRNR